MSICIGSRVERCLEGTYFLAVVQELYPKLHEAKLCYLDDGNVEDDVPLSDLRLADELDLSCCTQAEAKESQQQPQRKETLSKPLAGLVDDDSEQRSNNIPTVTVHASADTEEAIILNGAENKLAAGGGLRALRFLREKTEK